MRSSTGDCITKIFSGMAFGKIVYLSRYEDQHFTASSILVHIHVHQYKLINQIIDYFWFPRLVVAVALRPGDILIFNLLEPHAISSRCQIDDIIYFVSMYLKTAIVSLDDSRICLTPAQEKLKDQY